MELVEDDIEIGTGCSTLVLSLDNAEFLSREIGIHLLSEVFVAKWVVVNGIKYYKNALVVTGKSGDSAFPVFQQIVYILTMETADIRLVTAPWNTVKFDRHTHTYAVTPAENMVWSITKVKNLFDHHTYHASKSYTEEES